MSRFAAAAVVVLLSAAGCNSGGSNVAAVPDEPANPWYDVAVTGDARDVESAADADPNVRGRRGRTPLIEAIWAGKPAAVAALLDYGADPNLSDARSQTPLQYAARAREDRVGIAEQLLESGADVNAPGSRYPTPLYYAAEGGRAEMAELLLSYDADPTLADRKGRTPLDVARIKGRGEVVRLLKDAQGSGGVRWPARGRAGLSPPALSSVRARSRIASTTRRSVSAGSAAGGIGGPKATAYRVRRRGSQLVARPYRGPPRTTAGMTGTPASLAIRPSPGRMPPPRRTESPPRRIPPSGKRPTTRPRRRRSRRVRTVAGSGRRRSRGKAFIDPYSHAVNGRAKTSVMLTKSIARRQCSISSGTSYGLSWLLASRYAPCRSVWPAPRTVARPLVQKAGAPIHQTAR